ncbi:MAG TPA: hypothetical protein VN673_18455 [Clostridia bacterium]|nr:hypothetical protein [Clostridia bacterium]
MSSLESGSDDRLSRAMQAWTLDQALPPRFQEGVWSRIAQAESKPVGSFWASAIELFTTSFGPKAAYSYLAILLACGVGAGMWTAQLKNDRMESALSARYVQSVDPFQLAVHP